MTDDREINFEEAAAEARAPLNVESASFYDEGPEPDGDEDLDLPDPLDDLSAGMSATFLPLPATARA